MFLGIKCLELDSFLEENPVLDRVQLQTLVPIEEALFWRLWMASRIFLVLGSLAKILTFSGLKWCCVDFRCSEAEDVAEALRVLCALSFFPRGLAVADSSM